MLLLLLSNAVDEKDYARARETVGEMGLDPDSIDHHRPQPHGSVDRLFLDANVLFSAAYRARAGVAGLWNLDDVVLTTSTPPTTPSTNDDRPGGAGTGRRGEDIQLPDKDWPWRHRIPSDAPDHR
jgi:hypothetical protein